MLSVKAVLSCDLGVGLLTAGLHEKAWNGLFLGGNLCWAWNGWELEGIAL
jgi:hypothetical protein